MKFFVQTFNFLLIHVGFENLLLSPVPSYPGEDRGPVSEPPKLHLLIPAVVAEAVLALLLIIDNLWMGIIDWEKNKVDTQHTFVRDWRRHPAP